jgi:hypothetical protein
MYQIASIKAMSQLSDSQVTMTRHSNDRPKPRPEDGISSMRYAPLRLLIPQEIYKPTEVHGIP